MKSSHYNRMAHHVTTEWLTVLQSIGPLCFNQTTFLVLVEWLTMLCQSGSLYLGGVAHHILINFLNIYWAGGSLYFNSPSSVPYRPTRYCSSPYFRGSQSRCSPTVNVFRYTW